MYSPDRWVIFKVELAGKDPFYKVLAGWSGGYLDGDSWKINSGITKVTLEGDFYLFHGHSGSIYKCHKKSYGMNVLMSSVISPIKDQIEILDENSNFLDMKWCS